jgi:hypothetical protein
MYFMLFMVNLCENTSYFTMKDMKIMKRKFQLNRD